MDEDDREIRLLQEQFLPDGDLHSDGIGRMRRFRWNNIGMCRTAVIVLFAAVLGLVHMKKSR